MENWVTVESPITVELGVTTLVANVGVGSVEVEEGSAEVEEGRTDVEKVDEVEGRVDAAVDGDVVTDWQEVATAADVDKTVWTFVNVSVRTDPYSTAHTVSR